MNAETLPQITETIPQITESIEQTECIVPSIIETIPQVTETVSQISDSIQETVTAGFDWKELFSVWATWIEENEVFLDLSISMLSFVVTSVLTIVIIMQTSKLAKKQSKQDLLINKQQEDLQKRQMRIDTFDYKNTIYHALYKVFQMTAEIEDIFSHVNLGQKDMAQLYMMFEIIREQLKIDVSETMWLFKQAEYILPENIYLSVSAISRDFNELTGDIGKLKLFPAILNEDELSEEKENLLDDILFRAQQINKHVLFIESIMPIELDITNSSV